MTDMKPCPFCGRQPKASVRALSESDAKYYGKNFIAFRVCYGGGYCAHAHIAGYGETEETAGKTADENWNTRST